MWRQCLYLSLVVALLSLPVLHAHSGLAHEIRVELGKEPGMLLVSSPNGASHLAVDEIININWAKASAASLEVPMGVDEQTKRAFVGTSAVHSFNDWLIDPWYIERHIGVLGNTQYFFRKGDVHVKLSDSDVEGTFDQRVYYAKMTRGFLIVRPYSGYELRFMDATDIHSWTNGRFMPSIDVISQKNLAVIWDLKTAHKIGSEEVSGITAQGLRHGPERAIKVDDGYLHELGLILKGMPEDNGIVVCVKPNPLGPASCTISPPCHDAKHCIGKGSCMLNFYSLPVVTYESKDHWIEEIVCDSQIQELLEKEFSRIVVGKPVPTLIMMRLAMDYYGVIQLNPQRAAHGPWRIKAVVDFGRFGIFPMLERQVKETLQAVVQTNFKTQVVFEDPKPAQTAGPTIFVPLLLDLMRRALLSSTNF